MTDLQHSTLTTVPPLSPKCTYVQFKINKNFIGSFLKMLTELLTIVFMQFLKDFCEILPLQQSKNCAKLDCCLRRPVQSFVLYFHLSQQVSKNNIFIPFSMTYCRLKNNINLKAPLSSQLRYVTTHGEHIYSIFYSSATYHTARY